MNAKKLAIVSVALAGILAAAWSKRAAATTSSSRSRSASPAWSFAAPVFAPRGSSTPVATTVPIRAATTARTAATAGTATRRRSRTATTASTTRAGIATATACRIVRPLRQLAAGPRRARLALVVDRARSAPGA